MIEAEFFLFRYFGILLTLSVLPEVQEFRYSRLQKRCLRALTSCLDKTSDFSFIFLRTYWAFLAPCCEWFALQTNVISSGKLKGRNQQSGSTRASQ